MVVYGSYSYFCPMCEHTYSDNIDAIDAIIGTVT